MTKSHLGNAAPDDDSRPRVVFLCDEPLVPTTRGGRVATAGDIRALAAAGCSVTVVIPTDDSDAFAVDAAIHSQALDATVITYGRPRKLAANLRHPLVPHVAASRMPASQEQARLESRLRVLGDWDAVVCAHDYTVPQARRLARALGVPLLLRSHNRPVEVIWASAKAELPRLRGLFQMSEAARMAISHRANLREVSHVALLSARDLAGYRRAAPPKSVIGPVMTTEEELSAPVPGFDKRRPDSLLFVGALDTAQTAHGLTWFVRDVLPLVRATAPGTILRVVGRNAPERLESMLRATGGVEFVGPVDTLDRELDSARVFVNPVHLGSGINMKMGAPAARGLPIVTTSFGTRGLDPIKDALLTGDDPAEFAAQCVRVAQDKVLWETLSQRLRHKMTAFELTSVGRQLRALTLSLPYTPERNARGNA